MKTKTFDEYVIAQHAKQYHGTGDNMPDDYNDWRQCLDVEDVIDMAERWGKISKATPKTPSQVDVRAKFDEKFKGTTPADLNRLFPCKIKDSGINKAVRKMTDDEIDNTDEQYYCDDDSGIIYKESELDLTPKTDSKKKIIRQFITQVGFNEDAVDRDKYYNIAVSVKEMEDFIDRVKQFKEIK